jgi:hypothetical protein
VPPLQRARLTVDADVNGDGQQETGVFEMAGNLEIVPGIRTGFLIGGRGSTVNSVVSSLLGDGQSARKGIYLDLGGGARQVDINFWGWEGARDQDGNPLQWGNTGNTDSPTQADATGADPITQIDCLMQYLTVAEIDSRNPATLEYGEHHDDGLYDPLDVVVEGPQMTRAAEDGSWFVGQLTTLEAVDVDQVLDGQQRPAE